MGVPQIVKPDAGQGRVSQLAKPILRQRIRVYDAMMTIFRVIESRG
jgi:hypothetical protein